MNIDKLIIRQAFENDLVDIQKLFVDTISSVCINDYNPYQIKVWTLSIEDTQRWLDKLSNQYFLIAQFGKRIVGFGSLDNNNDIDLLYVHKDFQGQGIANRLLVELEQEAKKHDAKTVTSAVSINAKSFFEKKGFTTLNEQIVNIKGIDLVNYKMTKSI